MRFWNRMFLGWPTAQKPTSDSTVSASTGNASDSGDVNADTKYKYIIIGGGTGGCITAYTLAKQMEETGVGGRVLLVDGGKPYVQPDGPHPRMWEWFENWSKFSLIHDTFGIGHLPAPASSHMGIGGCGAHDTRITFYPGLAQRKRLSEKMGWSLGRVNAYIQSALNMMPIQSAHRGERFYDAVLKTLGDAGILKRVPENEYKGEIVPNSAAYVSIAMWPDETRWTSAYLLENPVRPKNLDVRTDFLVDKVLFDSNKRATGVLAAHGETVHLLNDINDVNPVSDVKRTADTLQSEANVGTADTLQSEVIVAAGSLNTPAILQRSGIGPKSVLDTLGIPVQVYNEHVGHGVDHTEIAVTYEWVPEWCEANGQIPRGGPMAWPIVMFLDDDIMVHFGISAPPYNSQNQITATPNCTTPDPAAGFHARIETTDPRVPITLRHADAPKDIAVLDKGLRKMISIFDVLQTHGLVGKRIAPSDAELQTGENLRDYICNNAGTAYHWMSSCKAGVDPSTTVADEHFRVRGVKGVRVGSGAALPELTEANPHLTISAFSIALAETVLLGHVAVTERTERTERGEHGFTGHSFAISREGNNPLITEIAKQYRNTRKD